MHVCLLAQLIALVCAGLNTGLGYIVMVGTLHPGRSKMRNPSGCHCCSSADNGDSPRMFGSIMQMLCLMLSMGTCVQESNRSLQTGTSLAVWC